MSNLASFMLPYSIVVVTEGGEECYTDSRASKNDLTNVDRLYLVLGGKLPTTVYSQSSVGSLSFS